MSNFIAFNAFPIIKFPFVPKVFLMINLPKNRGKTFMYLKGQETKSCSFFHLLKLFSTVNTDISLCQIRHYAKIIHLPYCILDAGENYLSECIPAQNAFETIKFSMSSLYYNGKILLPKASFFIDPSSAFMFYLH